MINGHIIKIGKKKRIRSFGVIFPMIQLTIERKIKFQGKKDRSNSKGRRMKEFNEAGCEVLNRLEEEGDY